ncbi:hypothetical protein E2C01_071990 [Portunus trituberculatus]|uniref:Uncharacterized protein n=1 Tax=Portunus trituberculatus TaxID=210409 RepID=A0A5B7I1E4_PORTR|nr:hypothetical protein [Portunus trituberculatus]
MRTVLAWRRPMILSQPSLVDPLYRKVQCCLILVHRRPVEVMMVRIPHRYAERLWSNDPAYLNSRCRLVV